MAYRKIPHDDRVKAVQEYGETKDIKSVVQKYKISRQTIVEDYNYVLKHADEVLKKNNLQRKLILLRIEIIKFCKFLVEKAKLKANG